MAGLVSAPHRPSRTPPRVWLRRCLTVAHRSLGLLAAAYAVVMGASGALLTFRDEVDFRLHRQLRSSGGAHFSADPDQMVAEVRRRWPNWQPLSLTWPHDQTTNPMIYLLRGAEAREVYFHPETGAIIGWRDPRAGWLGAVQALHSHLGLGLVGWGRAGRLANGCGALVLSGLVLSGLLLLGWGQWRSLRPQAAWARSTAGRWLKATHYLGGSFAAVFLLGLAFTGAYFTWMKQYVAVVDALLPRAGRVTLPPLAADAAPGTLPLSRLVAIAGRALPGRPVQRSPIPDPRFPLRITFCEGPFAAFHRVSAVVLDPRTGALLSVERMADRRAGDSLLGWFSAFHFGVFGGWPVRVLWAIVGLLAAALGLTGVGMWLRRHR